jgi:hypothetical protein
MEISLLLNDVPEATPEATTKSPGSPEIRKSTAIGTQTEPVPRDMAFLLKVDGSIQKVDVPLDEKGVAVRIGSMGWRSFMQDMLELVYTIDDEELPDVPMKQWFLEDNVRLSAKTWNITDSYADLFRIFHIQCMVKVFTRPCNTRFAHDLHPKTDFNQCVPLLTSSSQKWRGNMVLVCYFEHPLYGCKPWERPWELNKIVSPSEMLEAMPLTMVDFWDVDLQTWKEMLLAIAMATHKRLGMDAHAHMLDDNLLHMITDMALTHKFSAHVTDEVWDLRGIFHAMRKEYEFDDEDTHLTDEEDEDEDEDNWSIDSDMIDLMY